MDSLRRVLRKSIAEGQPRSGRPWRSVMVVVEGIYSMEGEMCPLKEIAALCKQYKVRPGSFLAIPQKHRCVAVPAASSVALCTYGGRCTADIPFT